MITDHIVEEVRKIRKNQAEKFNFDIKAIIVAAQKKQKKSAHTIVSLQSSAVSKK